MVSLFGTGVSLAVIRDKACDGSKQAQALLWVGLMGYGFGPILAGRWRGRVEVGLRPYF